MDRRCNDRCGEVNVGLDAPTGGRPLHRPLGAGRDGPPPGASHGAHAPLSHLGWGGGVGGWVVPRRVSTAQRPGSVFPTQFGATHKRTPARPGRGSPRPPPWFPPSHGHAVATNPLPYLHRWWRGGRGGGENRGETGEGGGGWATEEATLVLGAVFFGFPRLSTVSTPPPHPSTTCTTMGWPGSGKLFGPYRTRGRLDTHMMRAKARAAAKAPAPPKAPGRGKKAAAPVSGAAP